MEAVMDAEQEARRRSPPEKTPQVKEIPQEYLREISGGLSRGIVQWIQDTLPFKPTRH
jgi:hypothetical protein